MPPLPVAKDPLVGRVFHDRFRVEALIARGGMGKVYRALQDPLGRVVALKVLNPSYTGEIEHDFHQRFFLEASICARLSHPNTVTIFDYGRTDDDIYYIAMEFLEGRNLRQALSHTPVFEPARAVHIASQVCRSVREAHAMGVVHRDLKPANVFLVQHGDQSDFVKVLDFGLVKNVLDKNQSGLTQTGIFMGSPGYMSPEQIRGKPVDARADVYSLGVLLYEMLTGKAPFAGETSMETLLAHLNDPVPRFRQVNPQVQVPTILEQVVLRCLGKRADDRFIDMDQLLGALKTAAHQIGLSLSGESTTGSGPRLSRRISMVVASDPANPDRGPAGDPSGGWAVVPSKGVLSRAGRAISGKNDLAVAPLPGPLAPLVAPQVQEQVTGGEFEAPTSVSSMTEPELYPDMIGRAPRLPSARLRVVAVSLSAVALLLALVMGWMRLGGSNTDAQPIAARMHTEILPAPPPDPTILSGAQTALTNAPDVAPTVAREVFVSLSSKPVGAMVFMDDAMVCPTTPCELKWLGHQAAAGRRVSFRFALSGFEDAGVTRALDDATAIDVSAALVRKPGSRRGRKDGVAAAATSEPTATGERRSDGRSSGYRVNGYKDNPY